MNDQIKNLTSDFLKKIYLWAKESYLRTGIVIFIAIIIFPPIINFLQNSFLKIPIIPIISFVLKFFEKNFKIEHYIVSICFIFIIIWIYSIYKELLKTKSIAEKFEKDLGNWSIPINSGWTLQQGDDFLGKMLSVSNSHYPGILKNAYSWYDYEISFLTKFDKDLEQTNQNTNLIIRSENNSNGIVLSISKTHFKPKILYNGTYYSDEEKQLPTILKSDEWIKLKVTVKGDLVELFIHDYKLQYTIPSKILKVSNDVFQSPKEITLKDLEQSDKNISDMQNKAWGIFDEKIQEGKPDDRSIRFGEAWGKIPKYTMITFDYQKGSVGFKASYQEHTYFRNLLIKKIV